MRVSQRSKAMAFSMVGSWQLAEPQSTANCQLPTVNSLKLDTSPKSFLVPVKILQRLLGVLPAVVAAAVVEVDQPHALDVDAEAHDRLGPALHDALLFALGRLRQLVDVFHRLLRQALHLGEQRRGVLVRENLLYQRWTSASQRSNLLRNCSASPKRFERFRSSSVFSIFFSSASTFFANTSFPSRFQSGTLPVAEASSASSASSCSSAARFTLSISGLTAPACLASQRLKRSSFTCSTAPSSTGLPTAKVLLTMTR